MTSIGKENRSSQCLSYKTVREREGGERKKKGGGVGGGGGGSFMGVSNRSQMTRHYNGK